MAPLIPLLLPSLYTTTQPQNGLNPNADPASTSSSISIEPTTTLSVIPQDTGVGSAASAQAQAADDTRHTSNRSAALNPMLQNFLIAAGAIGK
jgi:hypothetical protein